MPTIAERAAEATTISRRALLAGYILSAVAVAFMLFDTVIHFLAPGPVAEAFVRLGYPLDLARPIAVVELVCLVAYAVPRTAVLGAVLLTGYLGGAIATQLRAGSPLPSETLFPVYVGVLLWAGIVLRDSSMRRSLWPFAGGREPGPPSRRVRQPSSRQSLP